MYKKLLGLLPLVWIVALAPNLVGLARPGVNSKPGLSRPKPTIAAHQSEFYRSQPTVIPLAVMTSGRSIKSVTFDGSPTGLSHPPVGQSVDFKNVVQPCSGCAVILLAAASVSRLPLGRQLLRVTLDDGAFVDFDLTIDNKPSAHSRRHSTGILASNKSVFGGNNERRILGPGTHGAVATL